MIEDNIRIDYEKLRMLIRKDKEFAHDASVIQTLVSQGYITGELKKGFPAVNITASSTRRDICCLIRQHSTACGF